MWPPLMEVLWYDASGDPDDVATPGESGGSLQVIKSAGYFSNLRLEGGPPALVISGDSWFDDKEKEHTLRQSTTVPLGWVILVTINGDIHHGPAFRYVKMPEESSGSSVPKRQIRRSR